MADHYYSIATRGAAFPRDPALITAGTSATGANPIELRITDGAMSAAEARAFAEWMADLLTTKEDPIAAATLL